MKVHQYIIGSLSDWRRSSWGCLLSCWPLRSLAIHLAAATHKHYCYCLSHGYIKSRCISVPTNIVRDFYCAPGSGFSYLKMVGSSTKLNIFILRILFRNPPCEAKTIHFQLLIQSRSSMRKPLSKNGQDFLNIRYNRGFNMDLDLIFSLLNLYSVLRIHNLIENHGTSRHTNSRTISWTWIDFKMADTSERRVFSNTILLKYYGFTEILGADNADKGRYLNLKKNILFVLFIGEMVFWNCYIQYID